MQENLDIDEEELRERRLIEGHDPSQWAWANYLNQYPWQILQTLSFNYKLSSATARDKVQILIRGIAKKAHTRVFYLWIMKTKGLQPTSHIHILLFGSPKPLNDPHVCDLLTPASNDPYMLDFKSDIPFPCEHYATMNFGLAPFYLTKTKNMTRHGNVWEFEDFYSSNPKTLTRFSMASAIEVAFPQDRKPLTNLENCVYRQRKTQDEGVIMKGSIQFLKDRRKWYVDYYHKGKHYKIYNYNGVPMVQTHKEKSKDFGYKSAQKLLALMQSDEEKHFFRIEKYTEEIPTDIIPYLFDWLEAVKDTLSPATIKDYKNSIKNHLIPFFKENPYQLHEIKYDVLVKLLNSIQREGKGKHNVLSCLRTCLSFAHKSNRISAMPAFPERKKYNIVEPAIKWISEERQIKIINAIPKIHQPIFWFLKYHLRRPAEAMALHKSDYDKTTGIFTIQRSFSNKKLVHFTKSHKVHLVPMHKDFKPYMKDMYVDISSPFFFVNPLGTLRGKYYTNSFLNDLWHKACREVGENISLYAGLKHSSISQLLNEYGYSKSELQIATDHANSRSLDKYASVEVQARKRVLEHEGKKIIPFKRADEN